MKIDLSCPMELWRSELPTADYPACQLTLYNLSDLTVVSVETTVMLLDEKDSESARVSYRTRDLKCLPGKTCRASIPVGADVPAAASCEVLIEKIWFDNGSVWRRSRGSLTTYTSNVLPKGRELDKLRALAGDTAVGYPQQQGNLWICVCGRPNPISDRSCIRCHRDWETVFQCFNEETVKAAIEQKESQLDTQSRAALEKTSQQQAEREKAYMARKKKYRVIAITAAGVLAAGAVAYGCVFHLMPYLRYQNAVAALDEGRSAEAEAVFSAMPGYRDADDYLLRCRYALASEDLDSGDADRLLTAEETFLALGTYEDSAEKALMARYQRAGVLLETGKLEDAEALYTELGDYSDSADQVVWCRYQRALALQDAGKWAEAAAAFEALGDYQDSVSHLAQANYELGKAALESGDAAQAIEKLSLSIEYEDAAALLKQAYYRQGLALKDAGDTDAAGEAFLAAGDYEDAAEQVTLCIYDPAITAMNSGDYTTAAELFSRIRGYKNADNLYNTCIYEQAKRAVHDLEYNRAISLLEGLPEGYEGAAALLLEAHYGAAGNLMNQGSYQAAADAFTALGNYADSADKAHAALYALALQKLEELDIDGAIALLESLPEDYEDSHERLLSARYTQAQQAQLAGELERAEKLYAALGDYEDSAVQLSSVRYAMAEALLDAGDYAAAASAFDALGDYEDSAARASAIRYTQAGQLKAEGNTESAAALYESLGDYEDSAQQAQALRYQLAEDMAAAGQTEEAATAFENLGNYEDSAERALALRYQLAQALMDAGDEAAAAEAFAALGNYSDSAMQAQAMSYAHAAELLEGGQVAEARELYVSLGDYAQAPERVQACDLLLAEAMAERGEITEAIAAFEALGDYGDAALQAQALHYRLGQQAMEADDLTAAAEQFALAGDYEDARQQMNICLGVYQRPLDQSQTALDAGDWQGAAAALQQVDMTNLPAQYAQMPDMYASACESACEALRLSGRYAEAATFAEEALAHATPEIESRLAALLKQACALEADRLLALGQDENALPYLLRIHGRPEAESLLERTAWKLMAAWQSEDGHTFIFNPDGTAVLDGETLLYALDGYSVLLGETADSMTVGLKLAYVTTERIALRDLRSNESISLTLDWAGTCALLPLPDGTASLGAMTEAQ